MSAETLDPIYLPLSVTLHGQNLQHAIYTMQIAPQIWMSLHWIERGTSNTIGKYTGHVDTQRVWPDMNGPMLLYWHKLYWSIMSSTVSLSSSLFLWLILGMGCLDWYGVNHSLPALHFNNSNYYYVTKTKQDLTLLMSKLSFSYIYF